MLTETITLEVEAEAARLFNNAPQTDKDKLQALFEALLRQYADADAGSLKATMDEIARRAKERRPDT